MQKTLIANRIGYDKLQEVKKVFKNLAKSPENVFDQ
jgi:hypothetical protein